MLRETSQCSHHKANALRGGLSSPEAPEEPDAETEWAEAQGEGGLGG